MVVVTIWDPCTGPRSARGACWVHGGLLSDQVTDTYAQILDLARCGSPPVACHVMSQAMSQISPDPRESRQEDTSRSRKFVGIKSLQPVLFISPSICYKSLSVCPRSSLCPSCPALLKAGLPAQQPPLHGAQTVHHPPVLLPTLNPSRSPTPDIAVHPLTTNHIQGAEHPKTRLSSTGPSVILKTLSTGQELDDVL